MDACDTRLAAGSLLAAAIQNKSVAPLPAAIVFIDSFRFDDWQIVIPTFDWSGETTLTKARPRDVRTEIGSEGNKLWKWFYVCRTCIEPVVQQSDRFRIAFFFFTIPRSPGSASPIGTQTARERVEGARCSRGAINNFHLKINKRLLMTWEKRQRRLGPWSSHAELTPTDSFIEKPFQSAIYRSRSDFQPSNDQQV